MADKPSPTKGESNDPQAADHIEGETDDLDLAVIEEAFFENFIKPLLPLGECVGDELEETD